MQLRIRTFAAVTFLATAAGVVSPGMARAQATYAVSISDQKYQPLPDSVSWATDENGVTTGPRADVAWDSDASWDCGVASCDGFANISVIDIDLPADFHFRLYGTEYSTVYMTSEGGVIGNGNYIPEGNDGYGKFPMGNPTGFIAGWWDTMVRSSTNSPRDGGMRYTIDGSGDSQILKMEWVNFTQGECHPSNEWACSSGAQYSWQIWVYSAGTRDSLVQLMYAQAPVPLNGFPSAIWYGGDISGSVGMDSNNGRDGLNALACTPTCTYNDWPADKLIQIGQGPDLTVKDVVGPKQGWAGVTTTLMATAVNQGAEDADGFGARFWVSESAVLDTMVALPVGTDPVDLLSGMVDPAGLKSATAGGGTASLYFHGPLPVDLPAPEYYVIAEVNPSTPDAPLGLLDEDTLANNTAAYGPFPIGPPTPDLTVGDITLTGADGGVPSGGSFLLDFVARNAGNLGATQVDYLVVLSANNVISASDTPLATGTVDMPGLSDAHPDGAPLNVKLPSDLAAGTYYLGIVLDPSNAVQEIDEFNNVGVLGQPFVVGGGSVQVLSGKMPDGFIGAPYCEKLKAAGGDGAYSWSLAAGSNLPSGLSLREEPADAKAKGLAFETLLCGVPAALGTFNFTLQVASAGQTATGPLSLNIGGHPGPLTIVTQQLPDATFQVPYEGDLMAGGGIPPYHWALVSGGPPSGMTLQGQGAVVGTPLLDGPSTFRVSVTDSSGPSQMVEGDVSLSVTPPGRLTCVQQKLPNGPVLENYDANLLAAGGQKPYTFNNVETRRLATSVGDQGETMADQAPPGLVLSETGKVSGTPAQGGDFLWTVLVTDKIGATDTCILAVDFIAGALSLSTGGLPSACVGQPYQVQLQAIGGQGSFKTWAVDDNSTLPPGLTLSPDGILSGTLGEEVLGGDATKTFNFTVRVRDAQNAQGIGGVTLRVAADCSPPTVRETKTTNKGCGSQSAPGAPSLLAVAALAMMARRRRR